MAIGERIHFFRMVRGLTQKQLGNAVGFREGTADVRIANTKPAQERQRPRSSQPSPKSWMSRPMHSLFRRLIPILV